MSLTGLPLSLVGIAHPPWSASSTRRAPAGRPRAGGPDASGFPAPTGSCLRHADVPFADLAALVASARCVVAGDTGLPHLATALGAPSVVLFGPVSPLLWGPPGHPRHRAVWHGDPHGAARPGDAHGESLDERLSRVTVEEVLRAVREARAYANRRDDEPTEVPR
ncbi:hypothetical protein CK485_12075 [Streptomyces sp. ICBB 8177]|nr:hypothetical protein CK485_12075 [Streptomyces sp. ICBB 8177]